MKKFQKKLWGVLGKQETYYSPGKFLGDPVPLNKNPYEPWDYKKSRYKRVDLYPKSDPQQAGVPESVATSPIPVSPTPTPSFTPTSTITPTPTLTPSPTPSPSLYTYLFEICYNAGSYFEYYNVSALLNVGDIYVIAGGTGFTGYATIVPYSAGTIDSYDAAGVTFTLSNSCQFLGQDFSVPYNDACGDACVNQGFDVEIYRDGTVSVPAIGEKVYATNDPNSISYFSGGSFWYFTDWGGDYSVQVDDNGEIIDVVDCTTCPSLSALSADIYFSSVTQIGSAYLAESNSIFLATNANPPTYRIDSAGNVLNTYNFGATNYSYFAKQSDGKVLAARGRELKRINTDGTIDSLFVSGITNSAANVGIYGVGVNPNDEIFIMGNFTAYTTSAGTSTINSGIMKLNSNGSVDTSYSGNTLMFNTNLSTIQFFTENKIFKDSNDNFLLSGSRGWNGDTSYAGALRLTSAGTLDTSFKTLGFSGTDGNRVFAIQQQSTGKYLLGGNITDYSGLTAQDWVIRVNTDGTLDTSFTFVPIENNSFQRPSFLAVDSNDKFYTRHGNGQWWRWNIDGTRDTSYTGNTSNGDQIVGVLDPATDSIYVGGSFTTWTNSGYTSPIRLIRLGSNNEREYVSGINTISGLTHWFKYNIGAGVSSWSNYGSLGGSVTQAVGANQPSILGTAPLGTFNNYPVSFTQRDFMQGTFSSATYTATTTFTVMSLNTTDGNGWNMSLSGAGTNNRTWEWQSRNTSTTSVARNQAGSYVSPTKLINPLLLITSGQSDSFFTATFNEVLGTSGTSTYTGVTSTVFNFGYDPGTTSSTNIQVYEHIIFNRVLDSSEVDQVTNYLKTKYQYSSW